MFRRISLMAVAVLLVGCLAVQAQFTPGQLSAWQATAETYYAEGVDENALLGNDYNAMGDIGPGMIGPDFTLLNMEGEAVTLSQFRGEAFVILISGSWY